MSLAYGKIIHVTDSIATDVRLKLFIVMVGSSPHCFPQPPKTILPFPTINDMYVLKAERPLFPFPPNLLSFLHLLSVALQVERHN